MADYLTGLKKVCVLGHFGFGRELLNGQTIKTIAVTDELQRQFGDSQVLKIDTYGGWKTLCKSPFQVIKALKSSKNILIFPAHNGLRVFVPLLSFFRRFFKNRKLYYVVIGGWLPSFLQKYGWLKNPLRKFDGIWVETSSMKSDMQKLDFSNVCVVPNFKSLQCVSAEECDEFSKHNHEVVRFCTFSRVSKEKGIEDAIDAVKRANDSFIGNVKITLDIYGQVDSEYVERFENLKKGFPDYISYKGIVSPGKSVAVLKDYYALLFPTHHYTEGVPGTLIDAMCSGLPVITAKWVNCDDVFSEGITGWGYEFDNTEELYNLIVKAIEQMEEFCRMRKTTVDFSKNFSRDSVMEIIKKYLK